jgi:hypothetical protein
MLALYQIIVATQHIVRIENVELKRGSLFRASCGPRADCKPGSVLARVLLEEGVYEARIRDDASSQFTRPAGFDRWRA